MHLVDWRSGAGQVVGSLKCTGSGGGGGGGVQGLWWVPSSESSHVLGGETGTPNDEKHLAVMTGEAEVYIWDVAQRRCVRRWKDEGGYRGAGRVFTGGGGKDGYMAIGCVVAPVFLSLVVALLCSRMLTFLDAGRRVGLSMYMARTRLLCLGTARTLPTLRPRTRQGNRS